MSSSSVTRATIAVASAAFVCLFFFEAAKSALLPALTLWQSHTLTIAFGTAVAALAAFFVLRAQSRLHASMLHEASERILAESAAKATLASERRYRGLVEDLPAAIVVHAGGRMLFMNPACLRMMEIDDASSVADRSLTSYTDEVDREQLAERIRLVEEGGVITQPMEYRLRTARGAALVVEATSVRIAHDGAQAVQTVLRDVTQQRRLESQLFHQAFHDALTGLANRALFRDRVEHALATSRRGPSTADRAGIAVLFIDLDHFKNVNDAHGHAIGDVVLQSVAQRLIGSTRGCDTVARLGGDEFAVVLEQVDGMDSANVVAQRILAELRAPFHVEGRELALGASVGIANCSLALDCDDLLRHADLALYAAKKQGRFRAITFAPEMHAAAVQRIDLESDLRRAVRDPGRSGFYLRYQPIIDLVTDAVVGVEALLRWNHPTRGDVPPLAIIPIAEESGLIMPLGRWVLQEACADLARWRASQLSAHAPHLLDALTVSVNLSARQLQDPHIVSDVATALNNHGVEPGSLVLEITESVMMVDPRLTLSRLRELKLLGVRVAIDDFGTGYSSLSYLRQYPVDIIKIDRSFVEHIGQGGDESVITTAIVSLGQALALRVIAEGIEEPAQLNRLRALGCEWGQGFLFARPMSSEQMRRTFAHGRHAAQMAIAE